MSEQGIDAADDHETQLTDVRYVGEATARVLRASTVTANDLVAKRVSFRQLVDAGVNPGVAARIRREHSLSWSFESSGDDLDRRSAQVRGLGDDERAWIAASSGDWERRTKKRAAETAADGSGDPRAAEAAWRDRSAPEPVTIVEGVDDALAARLAEGGITSVRSLATADVEHASDALGVEVGTLASLRARARARTE